MDKDYQQGLKSPLWQKKRLEIFNRDNFRCQFCGCNDRTLHIHHKVYEKGKKPWEYDNKDLVTVCDMCHDYVTADKSDLYETFICARDNMRKFGLSDSIFRTLLSRIECFFGFFVDRESYDCGFENIKNDELIPLIKDACYGTQYYDDAKTLLKLGIVNESFIESCFPMFVEDYKKTIENGTQV